MKTRYLFLLIFVFPLTWACSQEDIPVFDNDVAGIYFQRVSSWIEGGAESYSDSAAYSFSGAGADITQRTYNVVTIKSMGKQRDYDRPVKVVVDPERTTATRGVHFEVDTDNIVIKANESTTSLPVTLIRTPEMLEKVFCIAFKLEDNEHFECLLPTYKNTNSYTATGKQINGNRYIVSVNELYTQPSYWDTAGVHFGPWSPLKYQVVNMVTGWTPDDWRQGGYTGTKIVYGRLSFAAIQVQKYLQEMADADTPVTDNDGSYMRLADAYPIDYSRYE